MINLTHHLAKRPRKSACWCHRLVATVSETRGLQINSDHFRLPPWTFPGAGDKIHAVVGFTNFLAEVEAASGIAK
jgi:hypothetical protein